MLQSTLFSGCHVAKYPFFGVPCCKVPMLQSILFFKVDLELEFEVIQSMIQCSPWPRSSHVVNAGCVVFYRIHQSIGHVPHT
jgi:hypothetical protein